MADMKPAGAKRTVGLGLLAGIIFVPIVFVWPLLRRGHSGISRFFAFGWLGLSFLFVIGASLLDPPSVAPIANSNNSAIVVHPADQPKDSSISRKAGLGDTFAAINSAWDKGFRKEFDHSPNIDSMTIQVGTSSDTHIAYSTGMLGRCFGNPERAGQIEGNTKGLFGADPGAESNKAEFYAGVQDLMPRDSVWQKSFVVEKPYKKEVVVFMSESLAKLPDIQSSFAYSSLKGRVGTFFIIANYEPDDDTRISNFTLVLGQPNETDLTGTHQVMSNPLQ